MGENAFSVEKYAAKARQAVAEGIVLLKNDDNILPLVSGSRLALFGRSQFCYYKSGTGSGGLVNTAYVTGVREALERDGRFALNEELKRSYEEWLESHPFDQGDGWAREPWFQEEMPVSKELAEKAKQDSDTAVIIIGRTAGEDKDNLAAEGSYLLTAVEEEMLETVCSVFPRTVVLLNTGNIIDMKWVEKYRPGAVLYVWQGGQEGGSGVADVLSGDVCPSGRLSDTIARNIEDYPSTEHYGDGVRNFYAEDIYVGYRYFSTFGPEKVLYPFGFGLSYTDFDIRAEVDGALTEGMRVRVQVSNRGSCAGKEVVQVYCQAPQGLLGKPARVLCGFAKTETLPPGGSQELDIRIPMPCIASYDDSGVTGHKSCFVLEPGKYVFYVGENVRDACPGGSYILCGDTVVLEQLEEALAPVEAFKRMKPEEQEDGTYRVTWQQTPLRTVDPAQRRLSRLQASSAAGLPQDPQTLQPTGQHSQISGTAQIQQDLQRLTQSDGRLPQQECGFTGDKGYRLSDVESGKISMEEFLAQLTEEELCCIVRGEGMCSPKVTPGTAGAFGGVTESLLHYGIPLGCCADGPSGIRMDCGTIAFAMPNGTCLACTFNEKLSEELYQWEGLELRKNRVDTLLGPGMNLHRNPLNGRNFEYFSEDPLLTGKMAAAQLRGMHKYGVTGTVKHFACNNQEHSRSFADSVVSERALRELYLKSFEIAVKEGKARSVMSTYGPVNGIWTAGSYDLLTTILRKEWSYTGIVMTDWWAKANNEGGPASIQNMAAMVRAQNDLYMVTGDALSNSNGDNSMEELGRGTVARGEFVRNAANICRFLLETPAYLRMNGRETDLDRELQRCAEQENAEMGVLLKTEMAEEAEIDAALIDTSKGKSTTIQVAVKERGTFRLEFACRASENTADLAQLPLSVFQDRQLAGTVTIAGTDKEWQRKSVEFPVPLFHYTFFIKLFFGMSGMELKDVKVVMVQSMEKELRRQLKERREEAPE
ncbi:MAG: glycoside hydrolase family 3 C-terminal domain-containing protein [Butyrivibrio sp.]|nr:glycoside hydrolase family 3 C-terminal domain-containing protein [Acetatifactor muris]MCM1561673.1 glycoside hydrolase family 3 C-terminal domain-containing protein [Butyrivibrio sp.]